MALHQAMQKKNLKSTLAPTPREADHCCGVCIIHESEEDRDKIQTIADEISVKIDLFWETEITDDPSRHRFC